MRSRPCFLGCIRSELSLCALSCQGCLKLVRPKGNLMKDIIIQAVNFAVLSSTFIAVGLRLLFAKRTFIVSQLWTVIIFLGPATAVSLSMVWPRYPVESWVLRFLVVGGWTIIWAAALLSPRGGVVIGTTRTALRDALRHALHRLSLPYKESDRSFSLDTLNNELMVEAMVFNGMFVFRFKKFGNRHAIRQLTAEINDFYRTAPAKPIGA